MKSFLIAFLLFTSSIVFSQKSKKYYSAIESNEFIVGNIVTHDSIIIQGAIKKDCLPSNDVLEGTPNTIDGR